MILTKLTYIIILSLISFTISFLLYPAYIKLLKKLKIGKKLRETGTSGWKAEIFQKLHGHKAWTPTMGWWLLLFSVAIMLAISILAQKLWIVKYNLINQRETYILLFAIFSLWILGLVDDFLNIKWIWKVKGLTAKMKLAWMFLFSAFISYWFYYKLEIDWINLWPLDWAVHIWWFFIPLSFIFTIFIVNAVNITDWLDWLAWWLSLIVLFVLGIITFFYKWYLATAVIWIVIGAILAFLWFNINPAKIFLWDSGALAIWGLIATLVYLLNIKMWIIIPFLILFLIFEIEILSSFLQIISKKLFKKKLLPIAPLHHSLEYIWRKEYTIVMKFWLIQWVLAGITLILIFYQFM